jgi:hypothetical protein
MHGKSERKLTEVHQRRLDDAERTFSDMLYAHQQMRELVCPGEFIALGQQHQGATMATEVEKLERDIKKFTTTVLEVLAESLLSIGSLEDFRSSIEVDARDTLAWALAKVDKNDLPLLNIAALEEAMSKQVSRWTSQAQREFPPAWAATGMPTPPQAPEAPISGVIETRTSKAPSRDIESAQDVRNVRNIEFWQGLATQFRELGTRSPNLMATWTSSHWLEPGIQWYLSGGSNLGDQKRFEILAERAVVQLNYEAGPNAYLHWLDLLREDGPNSGPVGKLTGQDPHGNPIVDGLSYVTSLCETSATYCLRCESRTMVRDPLQLNRVSNVWRSGVPAQGSSNPLEAVLGGAGKLESGIRKKAGRPATISSELKEDALTVREKGGTWKDVAKKLYQTQYPSKQQIKNAPNVLKHYQKTVNSDLPNK